MPRDLTKDKDGLTPSQRLFVGEYVVNGGNGTQAAITAGYAADSAHQKAYELIRKTHIIAAVHAETLKHLSSLGPKALKVLAHLMDNASSESVRHQCAVDLANRGGTRVVAAPHKLERLSPQDLIKKFNDLAVQIQAIKDSIKPKLPMDEDDAPTPPVVTH